MINQMLRMLFAIGLASTAACTQQEPEPAPTVAQIQDGFAVRVSADATTCTVGGNEFSCVELPTYLSDVLQVPRSRYIVLSDSNVGRTDDGLVALIDALRKAGYRVVWSASLIMERRQLAYHWVAATDLPDAAGAPDRDKYVAIGESARYTLKFIKP